MNATEFESTLGGNGEITLPNEIRDAVPAGEPLKVLIMWESGSDADWSAAGYQAFASAYSPEDAVYEQLGDEPERG